MRFPPFIRSHGKDGLALVMVLAFVVLLAILVVSFLTFSGQNRVSTESYSQSIKAQEIAQGGLQDILSDLRSEIMAGSTVLNTNAAGTAYANSYATIYLPATNLTAVPARIGYTKTDWGTDASTGTFSPSLIRVSRATGNPNASGGDTFFSATPSYYKMANVPGGAILNRASLNTAGTATPSVNGRYISTARWNKTFLLANSTASVPTPFTSAPPDWVYVTRTGSRVCNAATELSSVLPSNNLTNNYGAVTPGVNPPASPIIGRYAFVMYDEGALLDANAAGYVSTATYSATGTFAFTNTAPVNIQTINGKSYLSYADLTQLPGMNQAAVDAFVKWRSAGGIAGGNNAGAGNTYLGAAFNYAQLGFLSSTNSGTTYDSPLVSRQDLINYFTTVDPNINTTSATFSKALPYLGTFTREVNAPSWYPPLNSANIPGYYATIVAAMATGPIPTGGKVTYNTSMETAGIANRDLPNVRFANTGTVTHYNDNTTTATYTVAVGDPLLQRRFSLTRIGWLKSTALGGSDSGGTDPTTGNGPSTTDMATAIQSCFGLVWGTPGSTSLGSGATTPSSTLANNGNACWNYVGSTGSSLPSSIETLDQVAAEVPPREPNFFELLKAAILNGSLGKSPGPAGWSNGSSGTSYDSDGSGGVAGDKGPCGFFCYSFDGHTGTGTATPSAPANIPDVQIIQIGANIIDQYGSDSYPTAIYFRYLTGTTMAGNTELSYDPVLGPTSNPTGNYGLYGPVDMVYGDKNLPLLDRFVQSFVTTSGNGTSGNPNDGTYAGANQIMDDEQVELWNPHNMPANALANVPQNFQIRAYGSATSYWEYQGHSTNAPTAPDSGTSTLTPYYQGTNSAEVCPNGTINFTDANAGAASSFYAHPYFLTANQPPGVTASSSPQNMAPASGTGYQYPFYDYPTATDVDGQLVAFSDGFSQSSGTTSPTAPFYIGYSGGAQTQGKMQEVPGSINTYTLGWLDASSRFHPYNFFTGMFTSEYDATGSGQESLFGSCEPSGGYQWYVLDPRTSRFSLQADWNFSPAKDTTRFASGLTGSQVGWYYPWQNIFGFNPSYAATATPTSSAYEYYLANAASATPNTAFTTPASYVFYADNDGVIRPGDGYFGKASTGDGEPLFTAAGTGGKALGDLKTGTFVDDLPVTTTNNSGNARHGRRAIILNRPFRNVGELGYVFRDLPFKTLDFFTTASADAALLDVFSITDEPKVVAGRVSLNNAPMPVIQSVLSMGSKKDMDPTYNIGAETTSTTGSLSLAIATQLKPTTTSTPGGGPIPGPLLNRAGLVTQLGATPGYAPAAPVSPYGVIYSGYKNTGVSTELYNKPYLEAPVRALADATNTRTWNLLIDVIAQSGHLSPTASSLDNFVVEGEKRYWLHIAIDRYTGKIVDQQLEPVYE